MRHELSTPYTWIYRWLIPAALTVAAVATLWWLVLSREGPPGATALIAATLIAAGALMLARVFDRAKRVWIDGDELVYAAYGTEYRIALAELKSVSVDRWCWPHRVRLTFRSATPFGSRIIFFPPLTGILSEPEVLQRLQQIIDRWSAAPDR